MSTAGLPITKIDDYKSGSLAIPMNNVSKNDLQNFINYWERPTLYQLLSSPLADKFIADLIDGVPQSERFLRLWNLGIKHILKCHIFYFYNTNDTNGYWAQSGFVYDKTDAATQVNPAVTFRACEKKFNECLKQCDEVQNVIRHRNLTENLYPEFLTYKNWYLSDPEIIPARRIKVKFAY